MNRRLPSFVLLLALCWIAISRADGAVCVAHTRLDDGHWQVWISDLEGANPRRISNSPWDKRCLRVGDGANVLLVRDNEGKLHRLNLDGGGAESLVALDFEVIKDFDFSPKSGFLIASYAPNALDNVCIWHVDREGQAKRLLISDPYLNEMPRWLTKGDRFLFAKSHAGKSDLCVSDLIRAEGGRSSSSMAPHRPAIPAQARTGPKWLFVDKAAPRSICGFALAMEPRLTNFMQVLAWRRSPHGRPMVSGFISPHGMARISGWPEFDPPAGISVSFLWKESTADVRWSSI